MNVKKSIAAVMTVPIMLLSAVSLPERNTTAAGTSFLAQKIENDTVTQNKTFFYDESEEYAVNSGSVRIDAPEKRIYKIGEELDLTGGKISAYGAVTIYSDRQPTGMTGANWDDFTRALELTDLDTSEFDNTKAGIYKIRAAHKGAPGGSYSYVKDNVRYDSFYVMVVDGEPTSEDTKKLEEAEAVQYKAEGTVKIKQPDKTVYKVGEELDLTGCTISGNGNIFKGSYNDNSVDYMGEWSIDSKPVTRADLACPYVNMNKAGTYSLSLDRLRNIDGYDIDKDNIKYDEIEIEIVDDNPTTVTTAVTTVNTGTKKTIVYTGAMVYDVVSVNTYPTQTVFLEGEEYNSKGLNVKSKRYIPYEKLGLNRDEYEPQPVSDTDVEIAASSVTIIDKDGEEYNAARMCQLPAGEYTVQIDKEDAKYTHYNVSLRNAEVSYDIEIKSSDLLTEKTVPSGTKPIFGYTHNYDQAFKGVAQYPTKVEYKQGEALDLTGLIIKAQRIIPYDVIFVSPSQYEEEPIYLKTMLPQASIMKITAADGKIYSGTDMPSLKAGKYTVSCKEDGVKWGGYSEYVTDVDLSYEIEIKANADSDKEPDTALKGDANCDGQIDMADIVLIMQALANPNKFGIAGADPNHITEEGFSCADSDGDGLTVNDALRIQQYLLGLITALA
ncbi:dockerin type I repeat-containing protein [Ruminococcus flavefaciens]|uniref:dockerin type I repeat-containing protein n=1 Tax=Ruminococcus flavefaciens TaxID=1265 RepID=UPI0026EAD7E0|nr:dockerin type I repeat-containing protein [Ruminococcus flavefaciens]